MPHYLMTVVEPSTGEPPTPEALDRIMTDVDAVHRAMQDAGVWVFGGGLLRQQASVVGTDGQVSDGPSPETKAVVGGFAVLEVASRAEALDWAARIARACRCAQEVREIGYDPDS